MPDTGSNRIGCGDLTKEEITIYQKVVDHIQRCTPCRKEAENRNAYSSTSTEPHPDSPRWVRKKR
jgi:hypothetical protein